MKPRKLHLLALLSVCGLSPLKGQFIVHDPAQTVATITQLQAQLTEWAEQHSQMGVLNDLNEQIRGYQEQLNTIIGIPEEAVKAIVDAEQLLERLTKFDSIENITDLESEIGRLENFAEAISNKSEIFGEIQNTIGNSDLEIVRDEQRYKRHVLTNNKVNAYETERNVTATELSGVAEQLVSAQEAASNATTESEQLAALIELQGINAQLRMMSLRVAIRSNDVTTHAIAVNDREEMEKKNQQDAYLAVAREELKVAQEAQKQNYLESVNSRRRRFGRPELTEVPDDFIKTN